VVAEKGQRAAKYNEKLATKASVDAKSKSRWNSD